MTDPLPTRLDDVAALPPSAEVDQAVDAIEPEGTEEFRVAGWRFVRPATDTQDMRAVFRDADGSVYIEGATVAVRFTEDTGDDAIEHVLEEYDLEVRRSVRFAPNAYLVSLRHRIGMGHLLQISEKLAALDSVEYAEPDFIEITGGRGDATS